MILAGDVSAAARALLYCPPGARWATVCLWVRQAQAARVHVRFHRSPHPDWGTGSLMARAMREPLPPEPDMADADYAACLILVLLAVQVHVRGHGPHEGRDPVTSIAP